MTTNDKMPDTLYAQRSERFGYIASPHRVEAGDVKYIRAALFAPVSNNGWMPIESAPRETRIHPRDAESWVEYNPDLASGETQVAVDNERSRSQGGCKADVEKLVEALRSIAGSTCCGSCQEAALVALQALAQHEGE